MTNREKYKTAQECAKAYCQSKMDTPFSDGDFCEKFEQFLDWLDLEAEEEPLPCPFCDAVRCLNVHECPYIGQYRVSEHDAIAAHNRVAKAVKESEGK